MVKFHNFIVNELKEIELHSKYTDLIDWKLKDNTDIITLKIYNWFYRVRCDR